MMKRVMGYWAILVAAMFFGARSACTCTIFSAIASNGEIWNGNNEDSSVFTEDVFLNVYPQTDQTRFGYYTYTHHQSDSADIQGGTNEAGLTFDFNALDREYPVLNLAAKKKFPHDDEAVIPYMMGNFESVHQVVKYFEEYWFATEGVMTKSQMHVADRHGDFAVIGPSGIIRSSTESRFLVSTNFNLGSGQDGSSCWRYPIVTERLQTKPANQALFTEICNKTAQRDSIRTIYSNVQNLSTGDVWLYFNLDYTHAYKTNIRTLLESGKKSFRIPDLFTN